MSCLSSKKIKANIVRLRKCVDKIKTEISNKNIAIRFISKDIMLAFFPETEPFLKYLESLGLSWQDLKNDLNGLEIVSRLSEKLTGETPPLTSDSSSAQIKAKITQIADKAKHLAFELNKSTSDVCYISRDVFVTLHPDYVKDVEYLENIGMPWSHVLAVAGLAYHDFFSKDAKKTAALHVKHIGELFRFTKERLLLFQKLLVLMYNENPARLALLVKDTLGCREFDNKKLNAMIGDTSSFVQYLQLIE